MQGTVSELRLRSVTLGKCFTCVPFRGKFTTRCIICLDSGFGLHGAAHPFSRCRETQKKRDLAEKNQKQLPHPPPGRRFHSFSPIPFFHYSLHCLCALPLFRSTPSPRTVPRAGNWPITWALVSANPSSNPASLHSYQLRNLPQPISLSANSAFLPCRAGINERKPCPADGVRWIV